MDATWGEVLASLEMPESVLAYLDWGAGVIRVNESEDTWNKLNISLQSVEKSNEYSYLIEALTHETIHFNHIVTTGYLYSLAVDLFLCICDVLPNPIMSPSDLLRPVPERTLQKVRAVSSRLDIPGAAGITVRSIVESTAFLAQKRSHIIGLDHYKYVEMLKKTSPGREYRQVYDWTSSVLGKEAFDAVPIIAYLSLCTRWPPDAYMLLTRTIEKNRLILSMENGIGRYLAIAKEMAALGIIAPLGTSAEVVKHLPKHPIYTDVIVRLNQLAENKGINIVMQMATPHIPCKDFFIESLRPILFNKTEEGWLVQVPKEIYPDKIDGYKLSTSRYLLLLAAMSARIFGEAQCLSLSNDYLYTL
jgi:hypothetical protein